ncbi:hypothetical protein C0993_011821, partial [Termitomyces sp. T159_Od127]
DLLVHQRSLVPPSCIPGTCAYPPALIFHPPLALAHLSGATSTPQHSSPTLLWPPTPRTLPVLCIHGHG